MSVLSVPWLGWRGALAAMIIPRWRCALAVIIIISNDNHCACCIVSMILVHECPLYYEFVISWMDENPKNRRCVMDFANQFNR